MLNLHMELILFDNGNSRFNSETNLLANFFYPLREKYPQITIKIYSGEAIRHLENYMNIDSFNKKYPVFIINGHVVSSSKTPVLKDIEKYIEEELF